MIDKEKILHAYGVANFMYENYEKFNCKELSREEIYILGLNHEIGYLITKEDDSEIGADILSFPRISKFIRFVDKTPSEYIKINKKIPSEMILLWYANTQIESYGQLAGEKVGFDIRLKHIENRFGKDSKQYKTFLETINFLKENSIE